MNAKILIIILVFEMNSNWAGTISIVSKLLDLYQREPTEYIRLVALSPSHTFADAAIYL